MVSADAIHEVRDLCARFHVVPGKRVPGRVLIQVCFKSLYIECDFGREESALVLVIDNFMVSQAIERKATA